MNLSTDQQHELAGITRAIEQYLIDRSKSQRRAVAIVRAVRNLLAEAGKQQA